MNEVCGPKLANMGTNGSAMQKMRMQKSRCDGLMVNNQETQNSFNCRVKEQQNKQQKEGQNQQQVQDVQ